MYILLGSLGHLGLLAGKFIRRVKYKLVKCMGLIVCPTLYMYISEKVKNRSIEP